LKARKTIYHERHEQQSAKLMRGFFPILHFVNYVLSRRHDGAFEKALQGKVSGSERGKEPGRCSNNSLCAGKNDRMKRESIHGYDADQARQIDRNFMQDSASLPQGLSSADLEQRAEDHATSSEQPLRALHPDRPRDYILESSLEEIDHEDISLQVWSKENGRLIQQEEVLLFESSPDRENVGNKEHDVWKVETDTGAFMIRRTKNGAYGLKFRSPYQYLQRMADVSARIPDAPISFVGCSRSHLGAGAIWTVQPYIEGEHPSDEELASWLVAQGWRQRDDRTHRYFEFQDTGIMVHDMHAGNCIKTPQGDIIPIDVFFEGLKN
jgi:hypothetical protein